MSPLVLLLAAAAMVASCANGGTPGRPSPAAALWLVTLADAPVALSELKAAADQPSSAGPSTSPRFSATSESAVRRASWLKQQADATARRALGNLLRIKHYYTITVAGFSIGPLTPEQVAALRQQPNVMSVEPDSAHRLSTISTPGFLGLDVPGGGWSQLGGADSAGEGVVIGMLDSGYHPEHPSFSDRADPNSNSGAVVFGPPPPHFRGSCQPGQNFSEATCNRKVIGCRYFYGGFLTADNLLSLYPDESVSCRDVNSHGSHTSSTAAGVRGVFSELAPAGMTMSGTAPRARLAVYKVGWGPGVLWTSDVVAAIDVAVADGVDVLNYSAADFAASSFLNIADAAFRGAAAAGVFVARAAGNTGPGGGTIAGGMGPWSMTVAASTHSRQVKATVTLGSGESFTGASLSFTALGPLPLLLAADAALASVDEARLCFASSLDAEKAAGKIVVCERGQNTRGEKAAEVARVNGLAMLLLDVAPGGGGPVAELLAVPHIHLPLSAYEGVISYATSAGGAATAAFATAVVDFNAIAPRVAEFSARGPLVAGGGDLLKPDIAAPGVAIIAAVPPATTKTGVASAVYSGTSMSTPAIAGIAALMKQKWPAWSVSAIKSALMTSAYQATRTGQPGQPSGDGPFEFGAGFVDPAAALSGPSLILDSNPRQWQRFVCGTEGPASQAWSASCPECVAEPGLCDPTTSLNQPAITVASLAGTKVVTRTLTSVMQEPAEFTAHVAPVPGFDVDVSPASFSLAPGASQEVSVRLQAQPGTPTGQWADGGAITWVCNTPAATRCQRTRIPVVLKAAELAVTPREVRLQPRVANITFAVVPSWSGRLSTLVIGLQPALRVFSGSFVRSATGGLLQTQGAGFSIRIARGAKGQWSLARFALSADGPPAPPGAMLDLFLFDQAAPVGVRSEPATAEVLIDVENPSGWFTAQVKGDLGPGVDVVRWKLAVMVLRLPAPGSSNAVSRPTAERPATAIPGQPVPVTVTLASRLLSVGDSSSTPCLGAVLYGRDATDALQRGMSAAKSMTLLYLP